MRRVNGWLTIFWIMMIPTSLITGWIASVTYVAVLSLWAEVSGRWAAWQAALERAVSIAIEEGHLKQDADPLQLVFELHGFILALHHDARFLRNPGALDRVRNAFERLVDHYATPSGLELLDVAPRAAAKPSRKAR